MSLLHIIGLDLLKRSKIRYNILFYIIKLFALIYIFIYMLAIAGHNDWTK